MMKQFVGVLMAALLAGCGTAVAPVTPEAPQAKVSSRHVLAAPGSTALWGVNFFQSITRSQGVRKVRGWTGTGRASWDRFPYDYTVDNTHPVYSGKNELERLSVERYAFTVPEGEVLVINQVSGKGVIYINGFAVPLSGESMPVHYLFGAGQLVVIRFAPALEFKKLESGDDWHRWTTKYFDMGISGFLGDPAMIAGSVTQK